MKRLVVCADGTWSSEDASGAPTNVARIHRALCCYPVDSPAGAPDQWVYYHDGVGTSPGSRVLGGMFGMGITRNLRSCYRFLVDRYETGDELWFFGFSRGAFTVRSLAGLIRNCGIVDDDSWIDKAIGHYRDARDPSWAPSGKAAIEFRAAHSRRTAGTEWKGGDGGYAGSPEIKFIGVWDTVGALGIPNRWFLRWTRPVFQLFGCNWWFHDTALSNSVQHAYQALAIHEERREFEPSLWTHPARPSPSGTPIVREDQDVAQVWFAGTHSDIGGGYGAAGLSDVTFAWMVENARAKGLMFRDGCMAFGSLHAPDPLARCHRSSEGIWQLLGTRPRQFGSTGVVSESVSDEARLRARWRPTGHWPPSFALTLDGQASRPVLESPGQRTT